MKKYNLIIFLLFIGSYLYSQQIHSPSEIIKIMSDSKVMYDIKMMDKAIDCPDYSQKLIDHDYYRVATDTGLITYSFNPNNDAKILFDKAESFFQSDADSALFYYKLSIEADTSLYKVITYIGQMYERKRDYENAIKWYKSAIAKNYIDYMAHWFLADAYYVTGDIKNAVDEIVIAHILNRNNQNIKKSMKRIFERSKNKIDDWYFNPQFELSKDSEGKVSISINEKWTGYAIAKALWAYEPGYSESMGVSPGQFSMLEEKECLISLFIGIENSKTKIKNDPQLSILKEAVDNKFLEEYIIYEIFLPKVPFIALQLPEQTIVSIKDYILTVRNKK